MLPNLCSLAAPGFIMFIFHLTEIDLDFKYDDLVFLLLKIITKHMEVVCKYL